MCGGRWDPNLQRCVRGAKFGYSTHMVSCALLLGTPATVERGSSCEVARYIASIVIFF